jgi:hypothetical protein
MRFLYVAILLGIAATTCADVILVPDEEAGIESIQEGLNIAASGDTVVLAAGTYDSVRSFITPLGLRNAICSVPDGVTLRGDRRRLVKIDMTAAEYGILFNNVGPEARVRNLTIIGGIRGAGGGGGDDDVRDMAAGIACVNGADATIENVTIRSVATGIIVLESSAPTITNTTIARGSHHGIYIYQNGAVPVEIDHVTVADNFDNGIYVWNGAVSITNSCVTHSGKSGIKSYLSDPILEYNNVYWNDRENAEPADYEGVPDQTGVSGNISKEPYYCDFFGTAGYNYLVCAQSPNVGADMHGGDIGIYGVDSGSAVNCTDCISPVEPTTWGSIKALFR